MQTAKNNQQTSISSSAIKIERNKGNLLFLFSAVLVWNDLYPGENDCSLINNVSLSFEIHCIRNSDRLKFKASQHFAYLC